MNTPARSSMAKGKADVTDPDWDVVLTRATGFTTDLITSALVEGMWSKVAQAEAEDISRKPAIGAYTMSGPMADANLSLNVAPGRIDWLYQRVLVDDLKSISLGKLSAQEKFVDLMSPWLQFPSIGLYRVAFGAVLRWRVDNRLDGYRRMATLLSSIKIDAEGSRDLVYQINRPRNSTTSSGLLLNRVSKWSVMQFQMATIGTSSGNSVVTTDTALQLELDLSTDYDVKHDLSKEGMAAKLFRELVSLGKEIALCGDVA